MICARYALQRFSCLMKHCVVRPGYGISEPNFFIK
ncbi:hypothetical protein SPAB_02217 [Salmonella enterica subsp. enterica serovar Paratyphi B str. SPB7]|uniref:Uncharacterized protein n=1 Tax=Salmonella paratyphi B (strain ATCC BAA-1250 / SPB7) TaxID=1016998 RepID=A0A6C6Z1R5_SALPB|nr:hypothetical protein SPAB_02217 [Salmonella enterica subsp. enterica serovar Paratyphi B str. SPB7]